MKRIANLPDTQEQLVSYVYKEAVSPPAKKATALGSINACVLSRWNTLAAAVSMFAGSS